MSSDSLLWGFLALLSLAWVLSGVLIGLVFSLAANERQREMAVLRATGATPFFIFRTLWMEAVLLATAGSIAGISVASLATYIFRDYLAGTLGMPFLFPNFTSFMALFALAFSLSIITVSIAIIIPAYRISQQEPALAMKE